MDSNPTLAKLATRTQHIAPFFVMELVKKADALAAAGRPVIHLSIGEPDFTAPPAVVKAANEAAARGRTQYTAATGIAPLRQAIARHYKDHWRQDVQPERIIVTAGASGALTLASCALVNPGDGVLMTDPVYPCNRHFVAAFDGEPQVVATSPADNFQMTDALLNAHWQPNTRGVLLSSPANPTGTSIANDELARILDSVRSRSGFAIVDEIYLGLSYRDDVRSALALGDDIIVTNSFSKYFNMTGWRLGWLVVPEPLVGAFEKLAQNLFICASSLAQQAALACFDPESLAIYEQRHQAFRERRDYLVPALRQIGLDIPVVPDGAFYVYADISKYASDSMQFALDLLEKASVAVVPGTDFGSNQPERYVRISYANSMENLKQAVERLDQYLNKS